MKKTFLTALHCIALLFVAQAQRTNSIYFGLGTGLSSYQDTKYSDNRYGGIGGNVELGWQRSSATSRWGLGLFVLGTNESPATHKQTNALTGNTAVQLTYLRAVNDRFFVGGRWDMVNFGIKKFKDLGNNGLYGLMSSNLLASGRYEQGKFSFGLDLGLLSFVKETFSFAFSVPQNALENGEFQYQNEALTSPFSFKYGSWHTGFSHFQIGTNARWQFSNRFSLGYRWEVRRFSEVEKRPVTIGFNSLALRWEFVKRTKGEAKN